MRRCLLGILIAILLPVNRSSAEDLRAQYGTRSATAATALHQGITLVQGKKRTRRCPI